MLISVINKKKLKKWFAVLLLIAVVVGVYVYFNRISYPVLVELAEIEADNYVTNLVNSAAKRIVELRSFYEDFFSYEKNNDGEVVLIKANTSSINQLMAFAQIEIQEELNKIEEKKIKIHLGAFTGSSLLADKGSEVVINILPIGNAVTKWESYYYNEGINQTIHRLVLRISADVKLIVPVKAKECRIDTDIILAEDVILGRVPETYINGVGADEINGNLFDLMP